MSLAGINWLTLHDDIRVVQSLRTFFFLVGSRPTWEKTLTDKVSHRIHAYDIQYKNSVPQRLGKESWTNDQSGIERFLASPQQRWDRLCSSPNLEMGTEGL
jgi:hypothetical protein